MRTLAGAWAFILICLPMQSQTPFRAPKKIFSLIVGVDEFADAGARWLYFAHRDAELFERQLTLAGSGQTLMERPIVLLNRNATRTRILDALSFIERNAGADHEVRIFISSNGRATPLSQEGFIGTYEGHGEKPHTAIRVSELRQFVANCEARVLLFADVSREQPVGGMDNRINLALRDLRKVRSTFGGMLSSEPSTASVESKDLEGGYGLFGYFLVQALQGGTGRYPYPGSVPARGGVTLDRVFEYLRQYLPDASRPLTKRPQKPMSIGNVGTLTYSAGLRQFGQPVLLAQAGALRPGDLAPPQAPELDSETREFVVSLANAVASDNFLQQDGVAELFGRIRPRLPSIRGPHNRRALRVGLEDAGQHIIARYGTGDQFPEDPRKLTAAHFALGEHLFSEAEVLRNEEETAGAETKFCERAVTIRDNPAVRSLEARMQFCRGRALLGDEMKRQRTAAEKAVLDRAAQSLQCAVELAPAMPEPRNAMGIVNLLRADFDEAIAQFRAAKLLAPDWAYPRHNLALAYVEKGLNQDAEREYRDAVERTPFYPYLSYNLGLLLQRQNRMKPAHRAYSTALRTFDQQIAVYRSRSSYLSNRGDQRLASMNLQIADVLTLNKAEAENALGTLEENRNKRALAVARYEAALRLNGSLLPARHNLGLLYARTEGERAKALWRENVRRAPDFHPSRLRLAEVLLAERNHAESVENFRAVLKALPENTEARVGLAVALAGLNNPDRTAEAIAVLKAAVGLQRDDIPTAILLGNLYSKVGDHERACQEYLRAEKLSKSATRAGKSELRSSQEKIRDCQTH